MDEDQVVTNDRWRVGNYLATYDATSPEYAMVRLVSFGVLAAVFLALGAIVTPALMLVGIFCLFAATLWWRRWRRACCDDQTAGG